MPQAYGIALISLGGVLGGAAISVVPSIVDGLKAPSINTQTRVSAGLRPYFVDYGDQDYRDRVPVLVAKDELGHATIPQNPPRLANPLISMMTYDMDRGSAGITLFSDETAKAVLDSITIETLGRLQCEPKPPPPPKPQVYMPLMAQVYHVSTNLNQDVIETEVYSYDQGLVFDGKEAIRLVISLHTDYEFSYAARARVTYEYAEGKKHTLVSDPFVVLSAQDDYKCDISDLAGRSPRPLRGS